MRFIDKNKIKDWFSEHVKIQDSRSFLKAITEKNVEALEDELNGRMLKLISYLDSHENFYHGFLVGVLSNVQGYEIKSNRESGKGRSDIFMKNKGVKKNTVIFELKVIKDREDPEMVASRALAQIEEKNYVAELEAAGFKDILQYGIAFRGKECLIKVK